VSTLARYLNRVFFVRFAVVAFAIVGFAAVVDLLDAGDDLVGSPEGPGAAVLRYLALRLPMMLSELMPLAALIAAIIAVGDLLRHRELVVVWGVGLSNLRVMRLLLPAALVLLVLKLALDDRAVPPAAAELRAWGVGEFKHLPSGSEVGPAYWLRTGDDVLRVSAAAASAGRLMDVELFRRDPQGLLIERVTAARAEPIPGGDGLRLVDAVRRVVATRSVEAAPAYDWPGGRDIDLDRLRVLATPPRELGSGRLFEILGGGAYGVRAAEPYLAALHGRVAGAVLPGLLILLAFGLARRFSRTATVAPILVMGIALGFLAIITGGVAGALGEVGVISPAAASWAPVLALAAVVLGLGSIGHRRLG
jgi:lipopolysaccharide export system permease protein